MQSTFEKVKRGIDTVRESVGSVLGTPPSSQEPGGAPSAEAPHSLQEDPIEVDEPEPKQRKKQADEEVEASAKKVAAWHKSHAVATSWIGIFGPIVDAFREVQEDLKVLPDNDGHPCTVPKNYSEKCTDAVRRNKDAYGALKRSVTKHIKMLVPTAADAAGRAAELHEANAALVENANAMQEAAQEAASKLQQTQVALHQSSAGHSNIGSAFPLSVEIAEKVKAFSTSEPHSSLVHEHLLDKFKTMEELSTAMAHLHSFCHKAVSHAFNQREAGIMGALSPIEERTPLIDGFLRRMWQEYHATFLPTENVSPCLEAFPGYISQQVLESGEEDPSLQAWRTLCAADADGPDCVAQVMRELLQLYVFTTVCDPPMKWNPEDVGEKHSFNPDLMQPFDDKIKQGKPCYIVCPALFAADGLLKAKAKVLAADYL